MKALLHFFAGLLLLVALGSLTMPIAMIANIGDPNSSDWPMLLFAVPSLLFSVIVSLIVFRHFRRRDHASAVSLVTAFCFFAWLILNAANATLDEAHARSEDLFLFLHFAAPILVAVLLNRLLQNAVARHFGKPTPA